jgi:hypothetical protein
MPTRIKVERTIDTAAGYLVIANDNGFGDDLKAFAKKHGGEYSFTIGQYFIETKDWGVEVIPSDGIAQVHGYKDLSGISTNIESADDLDAALDRLKAAVK